MKPQFEIRSLHAWAPVNELFRLFRVKGHVPIMALTGHVQLQASLATGITDDSFSTRQPRLMSGVATSQPVRLCVAMLHATEEKLKKS